MTPPTCPYCDNPCHPLGTGHDRRRNWFTCTPCHYATWTEETP